MTGREGCLSGGTRCWLRTLTAHEVRYCCVCLCTPGSRFVVGDSLGSLGVVNLDTAEVQFNKIFTGA